MNQNISEEDYNYDAEGYDSDDFQLSPHSVEDPDTPRTRLKKKKRKQNQSKDKIDNLSDEDNGTFTLKEPLPELKDIVPSVVTETEPLSSSMSSNSPEDDEIRITPGQEQAIQELQDMKNDMDFLPDEEPPDYDVTERVKQLNQELANEPEPGDERQRSIKFKEKVVDFEVPPENYSEDEGSEGANKTSKLKPTPSDTGSTTRPDNTDDGSPSISSQSLSDDKEKQSEANQNIENNLNDDTIRDKSNDTNDNDKVTDSESQVSVNDSKNNDNNNNDTSTEDADHKNKYSEEKIVVERDGKFEVLNAKDLTPEERDLYLSKTNNDDEHVKDEVSDHGSTGNTSNRSSNSSASSEMMIPHPPTNERPATSAGHRRSKKTVPKRRAQSAQHSEFLDNFDYTSPYALSEEEKKRGMKAKEQQEKQKKEKQEKLREDDENKRRDNNSAFEAWLGKKKKNQRNRSNSRESRSSNNSQQTDSSEAFESWLKMKNKDLKQRKKVEKQHNEEFQNGFYCRPRKECDMAFRQWLKKKNKDMQKQQLLDRHRTKIGQLLGRRTHTALAIARAMKQSQSFHYVDYYGYRY